MRRSSRLNLKVLQSEEKYKKSEQEKTAPLLKEDDTENGKSECLNNIEPSTKRLRRSRRNSNNEAVAGSYEPSKSEDFKSEKENECTYGDKVIQKESNKPDLIPVPEEVSISDKIPNNDDVEAEGCISQNLDSPDSHICHLACVSDNEHMDKANGNSSDNSELSEQSSTSDVDVNMAVVNFVKSAEPNEINIPKEKEKRKSSGKLRRLGNTESDTVALQNSSLDIVSLPSVVVADVEEVGESTEKHASSDAIVFVDGDNNIEESVPVMEEEILNVNPKKVQSFCLDRSKYENFNKLSSNPLMQTLSQLKKNFPFKDQVKGIYKDSKTLKNDINLDGITLQKDTPVDKNDLSKLSSNIQTKAPSVYFDVSAPTPNAGNINKNVEKLMKMSVLPDDLEKMEKTPKLYESKNSTKLKRKKEREETAGKGWYNLPKTEMTEKIKNDLQLIKMRNVLDSKHHYKRNDTNKLPKYFQMGTVVTGAHEFYSSRVPKKQRKRTMVDELLDDAEYRRKNKKKYIEIRKKQLSGGKGFYKKLKNKKKATWERD